MPRTQPAPAAHDRPGAVAAGGLAPLEDPLDEASEIVADAALVAQTAARLDEGPTLPPPADGADHLTPDTLLGGHRDHR